MPFTNIAKKGQIGNLEIKNRLVMTAMGVGVGDHSGIVPDEFIEFIHSVQEAEPDLLLQKLPELIMFMAWGNMISFHLQMTM